MRAITPPDQAVAWWKGQLEMEMEAAREHSRQDRRRPHEQRRRRRHEEDYSEDDDDYDGPNDRRQAEMDELRDALRAARRQLAAGERREKALRRDMRSQGLPPLPGQGPDGTGGAEDSGHRPQSAWQYDGDGTRRARRGAAAGL